MATEAVERCRPAEAFPRLADLIRYLEGLRGRADLGVLSELLARADVTRADLKSVCVFGERGYRRNTISRGRWHELLALCWRSGHCTPIHDHRGSSCAFRVVEGLGTEIRYRLTDSGLACPVAAVPMPVGHICAAKDEDIHQVANLQSAGTDLITLHIYSPPIEKMHTYEGPLGSVECAGIPC
jgi:cysteine dioxygenase